MPGGGVTGECGCQHTVWRLTRTIEAPRILRTYSRRSLHLHARRGCGNPLQPLGSQAKAYQVKQVRGVIAKYGVAIAERQQQTPKTDSGKGDRKRKNMRNSIRYEIILDWNEIDKSFIAEVP